MCQRGGKIEEVCYSDRRSGYLEQAAEELEEAELFIIFNRHMDWYLDSKGIEGYSPNAQ